MIIFLLLFIFLIPIITQVNAQSKKTLLKENFNDSIANDFIEKGTWGHWYINADYEYVGTIELLKYPEEPISSYYPLRFSSSFKPINIILQEVL